MVGVVGSSPIAPTNLLVLRKALSGNAQCFFFVRCTTCRGLGSLHAEDCQADTGGGPSVGHGHGHGS